MASGKPFNPSMIATRDVFKPAVVEFVLPRQPELGSFTLLDPRPNTSLFPLRCKVKRFVLDQPFITDLDPQGIEKHYRIHQGQVLPLDYILHHRINHRTDQMSQNFHLVLVLQETLDLVHRHILGLHRYDFGIGSAKALLTFPNKLRFKLSSPIPGNFDQELPLLT